jgi:glucose-6-phosphate-specific signal transduction histidine kinase
LLPKLRAVDVRSSHQFEEEIGAASSENGFFIAKIEFSVRTMLLTSFTGALTPFCILFTFHLRSSRWGSCRDELITKR